jgi:hypothetical protein
MGENTEVSLLRELVNKADEVVRAKDEALRAKDEALRAKDELVNKADEVVRAKEADAVAELQLVRADMRRAADEAVRTLEGVKLRGIVEYLAKVHDKPGGTQHGLDALFSNDVRLQQVVNAFSTEFKLLPEHLNRCYGGLYHTLSKELHGSEARVEVHEADWRSPGERALLCALLERFSVTYAYFDPQDQKTESPYAELAKRAMVAVPPLWGGPRQESLPTATGA